MTFEEWWGDEPKHGMITAREAWKAAQTAEREKYENLVTAAEDAYSSYLYNSGIDSEMRNLKSVLSNLQKGKND